MNNFWDTQRILLVLTGSQSYGTNTPDSDIDTRGICIPSKKHLLGLDRFELYEHPTKDEVIYSLHKFVGMALQNNPNIMEILYSADDFILEIYPIGQSLLDIRDKFLSKKIFNTYGGYVRGRYGKLERETATGKRKELIDKYQFDTKDAAHIIRLLDSSREGLETGTITVRRENADFLLSIRQGDVSLKDFYALMEERELLLRKAYENTKLSDEPDRAFVNQWLTDMHMKFLNNEF